jgi:Uri superfamily endonuclease
MGSGDVAQRRANEHGRGIPEDDRGAAFLKQCVYRFKTLGGLCTTTSRFIERQQQNRRHIAMLTQHAKDFDAIITIDVKNQIRKALDDHEAQVVDRQRRGIA